MKEQETTAPSVAKSNFSELEKQVRKLAQEEKLIAVNPTEEVLSDKLIDFINYVEGTHIGILDSTEEVKIETFGNILFNFIVLSEQYNIDLQFALKLALDNKKK
jgi:hypothetical protein